VNNENLATSPIDFNSVTRELAAAPAKDSRMIEVSTVPPYVQPALGHDPTAATPSDQLLVTQQPAVPCCEEPDVGSLVPVVRPSELLVTQQPALLSGEDPDVGSPVPVVRPSEVLVIQQSPVLSGEDVSSPVPVVRPKKMLDGEF